MTGRPWTKLGALVATAVACAAPPRAVDSQVVPTPLGELPLAGFDDLLGEYVEEGFVDYRAFCGSSTFARHLEAVAGADATGASPAQHLAFLLNAYNAAAIQGVVQGGRPATLFGRYRFFLRTRHEIAGERITLWDLEHERIRPLGEARTHFAIVCASASCPRLASEAYRAETLEAQLEGATRAFVNDPSRNRFYLDERVAELSAIFDWYEEDFLAEAPSLPEYVARYVEDAELARALREGGFEVRFLRYDWSLNGVPPTAGARCPAAGSP